MMLDLGLLDKQTSNDILKLYKKYKSLILDNKNGDEIINKIDQILKEKYNKEISSKLQKDLELKNVMQIPTLQKIVINSGVGKATQQGNLIEGAVKDLTAISGQKAMVTRARKSIAGFKLREGQAIGAKVTLRGDQMWEFFDRLITLSIPRIRDFRGLSPKSFDGRGNYSLGIREQIIFPEISYDKIDKIKLIEIVLATDGPDILTRCAFGLEKCTSEKPCPFHDKFKGIREELRDSLSEISVYDMALKTEQGIAFLKN